MTGCGDVCEQITELLLDLGLAVNTEDDNHDDIVAALGQVTIVKGTAGPFCPECGNRMTQVGGGRPVACYDCPTCQAHWRYDGDEGTYECLGGPEDCSECNEPDEQLV